MARVWDFLRHPIPAAVATAAILGIFGLAWAAARGGEGQPVLTSLSARIAADPEAIGLNPGEPLFYWLPGKVPDAGAPPEDCRLRRAWALRRGGADADISWASLVMENNRASEITIENLHVEVVKTISSRGGSVAACPVGGASTTPYQLLVNLDTNPASVTFAKRRDGKEGPVPDFLLAPGEQDQISIWARAFKPRVHSWRLTAEVVSKGKRTTLIIQDGGKPLRTAGTDRLPAYEWQGRADGWVPYTG